MRGASLENLVDCISARLGNSMLLNLPPDQRGLVMKPMSAAERAGQLRRTFQTSLALGAQVSSTRQASR
jgi:hypothetical protein